MPAPSPRDASTPLAAPSSQQGTHLALRILAVVAPVLFLQIAVVYPNSQQLAAMRDQVARLESTIVELKGHEPTVGRATGLLAELGEQHDRLAAAEATLDRLVHLDRRLTRGAAHATHASVSIERYEQLADRVARQSRQLEAAESALSTLADLPARLEAALRRTNRMAPMVAEASRMATRIETARGLLDESIERVEEVAQRQETLACIATKAGSASSRIEELVSLAERLGAPTPAVEAAAERLDQLVSLKEAVLAQTEDLPEAFDTFDLIVRLQADYQQARSVFSTAQRLLSDLVLLEPAIARIAAVVDPMIERTSIANLGGGELRMVLRELQDRRGVALAKLRQAEAETSVASRNDNAAVK